MRSTQDPIAGLKHKILEWGVTNEEELKGIEDVGVIVGDEDTGRQFGVGGFRGDGLGGGAHARLQVSGTGCRNGIRLCFIMGRG